MELSRVKLWEVVRFAIEKDIIKYDIGDEDNGAVLLGGPPGFEAEECLVPLLLEEDRVGLGVVQGESLGELALEVGGVGGVEAQIVDRKGRGVDTDVDSSIESEVLSTLKPDLFESIRLSTAPNKVRVKVTLNLGLRDSGRNDKVGITTNCLKVDL